ncbi:hypothetical protein ABZ714_34385 [Streptomyces sp. NPDC006798]|uniref:hypothetical protein n=1 Tax=Streptomyces sp. NPDC006798 TaxID=3155462 RepID=UPI0033E96661
MNPADELRAAAFLMRNPMHITTGVTLPDLAAQLADWLDHAATAHDASVAAAASVWPDPADAAERIAWVARQTELPALAVARAITQDQP